MLKDGINTETDLSSFSFRQISQHNLWGGKMKRIVTIQDISCVGKCSLTVALPVISATGVEAAIIPTAVLSTHTMFKDFTCKDLDDQIIPICNHWKNQGITFDAFYTGYLASEEQIQKVIDVIADLKSENSLVIVDPAMADNGKLYPAFNENFPKEMAKLCATADIVIPNITEACLMTDTEYKEIYTQEFAQDVIKKLADMGAEKVILTGATFGDKYGVMIYDSTTKEFSTYYHKKHNNSYHGTGDIFSSAFTGSFVRGNSLMKSIEIAADYTAECIRLTAENKKANWYGVEFERAIPYLIKKLNS